MKQYKKSIEEFEKWNNIFQTEPDSYFYISLNYIELKNFEKAYENIYKTLEIYPNYEKALKIKEELEEKLNIKKKNKNIKIEENENNLTKLEKVKNEIIQKTPAKKKCY